MYDAYDIYDQVNIKNISHCRLFVCSNLIRLAMAVGPARAHGNEMLDPQMPGNLVAGGPHGQ